MFEICRFNSKMTEEDFINFRKSFIKAQSQGKILYIMIVVFFSMTLYTSIIYKEYSTIIMFCAVAAICVLSYFVSYFLKPKIEAKNLFKNDYTYLYENEIAIFDDHIETKILSNDNDYTRETYYPYSMVNAALEDINSIYLQFNLSEVRVLSKKDIPTDKLESVRKAIEKTCGKIKKIK